MKRWRRVVGSGVRGQGANMGFGNNQILTCSQDVTHYPSQAKHPHYITSTDLADCSPACKHDRLTKVHLANSSKFSAGRLHKRHVTRHLET